MLELDVGDPRVTLSDPRVSETQCFWGGGGGGLFWSITLQTCATGITCHAMNSDPNDRLLDKANPSHMGRDAREECDRANQTPALSRTHPQRAAQEGSREVSIHNSPTHRTTNTNTGKHQYVDTMHAT